jgi:hypothetical protein
MYWAPEWGMPQQASAGTYPVAQQLQRGWQYELTTQKQQTANTAS